MANNLEYKLWFGKYTKTRFNKVKGDYKKIKAGFEEKQFTYDLTGQGCDTGVFAYTYKGGTTIWLCDAFWQAPDTDTDSRQALLSMSAATLQPLQMTLPMARMGANGWPFLPRHRR